MGDNILCRWFNIPLFVCSLLSGDFCSTHPDGHACPNQTSTVAVATVDPVKATKSVQTSKQCLITRAWLICHAKLLTITPLARECFFSHRYRQTFSVCTTSGADEQELATPILSLCHGIFTDWSIFSTPFLLWKKGSSGPVTQWRQLVSCDWLWHSQGSLIQSRFDLKINRSMKTPWQKYSEVACSCS